MSAARRCKRGRSRDRARLVPRSLRFPCFPVYPVFVAGSWIEKPSAVAVRKNGRIGSSAYASSQRVIRVSPIPVHSSINEYFSLIRRVPGNIPFENLPIFWNVKKTLTKINRWQSFIEHGIIFGTMERGTSGKLRADTRRTG